MAERYVRMNILSTGGDRAKATLDELAMRARKLEAESPELKITADDTKAQARLKDVQLKIDILNHQTAEVAIETKGDEKVRAKLLDISAQLAKLDGKVAKPGVTLDDFDRTEAKLIRLKLLLDSLHNQHIRISESTSGGNFFQRLIGRGLFGIGSGGGGGGGEAAGSAGRFGSGALSALAGASNAFAGAGIAGLAAILGSIAPAIIPLGIGGGVGIGGGILAATLGSSGASKLAADRQALARAQASVAGSKSGGSQSQLLSLHLAQSKLAHDRGIYGGFAPFGKTVSGVGHSLLDTLAGALTSRGMSRRGSHGEMPVGQSFLGGLGGIMKQFGGFVKSMGPGLGEMFRASLPFLRMFADLMEKSGKILLPVFTQAMKQITPLLPTLEKGFLQLVKGLAGFIKALGPGGMKDAATVFVALMTAAKGILIALGHVFVFLAHVFARFGHNVKTGVKQIIGFFKDLWHYVVSDSLSGWHKLKALEQEGLHDIAHIFDEIRHTISSVWDTIWRNTVTRVQHGITDVRNWFHKLPGMISNALGSLGSMLYNIGVQAIHSLINGLKSTPIGGVIGGISSVVSSIIPHASGGWLTEPIVGVGLNTDQLHSFAENGPEYVSPGGPMGGSGTTSIVISAQGDDLVQAIVKSLRYEIRTQGGGNVQQHLGWGSV